MATLLIIICLANLMWFSLRVYLAVRHPATFEAVEKLENQRRDRNKQNLVGVMRVGFGVYKALRR